MTQPLVAVSTDIRHFENYTWHAAPAAISGGRALTVAGVLPVLVPSFGERLDFDGLLSRVDGVMLTGSKSNVNPTLYGGEPTRRTAPMTTGATPPPCR
jgi:putative glutamine amidotransferase